MMLRRILGEKAFARRRDEGMSDISKYLRRSARGWMQDDAHPELVGGAFKAEGYHRGLGTSHHSLKKTKGVCSVGSERATAGR
jgi:hypothetical protein